MKRRLPPLNAVRAFEVAAEHESFAVAAGELGVTKGAVSQQVRALEDYLGSPLFVRRARGLRLTDAGRQYHSAVRSSLNTLERATARFVPPRTRATLKLSVLPAFASMWLVPRFTDFQARHANIDVQLSANAEIVDFDRGDVQVGIRYGTGGMRGGGVHSLGRDRLFPVCAPAYADARGLRTPADLAGCRLLHDTYWQDDWRRWAEAAGIDLPNRHTGQYFTHYSMAADAARAGAGVLIGHERLLAPALAAGELVRLPGPDIAATDAYYVVYPPRCAHVAAVNDFVAWLLAAAKDG